MTGHRFFIQDWRPASLNKLIGCHWAVSGKIKKADMETIWSHSRRVPLATGKRIVGVKIYLKGKQKPYDDDNLWKSLMDALVKLKLLIDDSPKWVETMKPEYIKGEMSGTEIFLRDIP